MIRAIIADDHSVIREGLKLIIEQDPEIKVVGCAENGMEAFKLCEKLLPDIVLMDIIMPVCDGIEGTRLIKENHKTVKVLILTTFNNVESGTKTLRSGADGYILKDIASEELISSIKSLVKGLKVIHQDTFDEVIKQFHEEKQHPSNQWSREVYGLTEREIQVIKLIVYGKYSKEIASTLFLSEGTVRNMISKILEKLNLKDRTQLAVFAVRNKIV